MHLPVAVPVLNETLKRGFSPLYAVRVSTWLADQQSPSLSACVDHGVEEALCFSEELVAVREL